MSSDCNLEAIKKMITYETGEYGERVICTIDKNCNGEYTVSFKDNFFKSVTIKVRWVCHSSLEYSEFDILIIDDRWTGFCAADSTIKELWKRLL